MKTIYISKTYFGQKVDVNLNKSTTQKFVNSIRSVPFKMLNINNWKKNRPNQTVRDNEQ